MYGFNGYYQPNYQPSYYQQSSNDERIWVQNQTSAEAYLVAPNGFVRLWDANRPVFYEKKADPTGRPYPLEVYEYTRQAARSDVDAAKADKTITDEIERLKSRLSALEKEVRYAPESDTVDSAIPEV